MDIINGLTCLIKKFLGPFKRPSLLRSILKCPLILAYIFLAVYVVLPNLHGHIIGNIVRRERVSFRDGNYAVVDSYKRELLSVSSTSKLRAYKTVTYYDSTGECIWDLTLDGEFQVDYGHDATATAADSRVQLFDRSAKFIGKDAYTSENTATALGTVGYHASVTTMRVHMTCDRFGNLW